MYVFVRPLRRLIAVLALGLAGCATSGNDFDPNGLTRLVPGVTTLTDATVLLRGYPAQTYSSVQGATTALWSYRVSGPSDLAYRHKSALVQFAPDGTFERIVETSGVLIDAGEYRRQLEQAAFACPAPQTAYCPPQLPASY